VDKAVCEQLGYSRAHPMLGLKCRCKNTDVHMDDIVRDAADCVDYWVHRHARGQRVDSYPSGVCGHFFELHFVAGKRTTWRLPVWLILRVNPSLSGE
jgi:hypothetical protein